MQLDELKDLLRGHLEGNYGTRALRPGTERPARNSLNGSSTRELSLERLLAYAHGDHWQNGGAWRGRVPRGGNLNAIKKLFTSDDQLTPALQRFVASIAGRDFEWETSLAELEEPVTAWHHDARLHQELQRALYLMFATGRSFLRLYIPDEYGVDIENARTIEQALELIHIQVLHAGQAGVLKDDHGREVAYYYRYSVREGEKDIPHVELHTPETIYRFRHEAELLAAPGPDGTAEWPNPLYDPERKRRPRFLMFKLDRGEPMLAPSIIDKQDGLNVTWTNMRRNDDLSGFRSIVTMNADDPVEELPDGTLKPMEWTAGPDMVINLKGVPRGITLEGEEVGGREQPSFGVIDPVDPRYFLEAVDAWRKAIASDFNQGFVFNAYRAVSGSAKSEDRTAFDRTVMLESTHAIQAARWILEGVAGYAGDVIEDESYKAAEFTPKFFLDVSRGNLNLFLALVQAYAMNLVSDDLVVAANPAAEDTALELQRIRAKPKVDATTPPAETPPAEIVQPIRDPMPEVEP